MSIIGSMNIAQSGLNVSQMGLMVVSNNVANMNTPGYAKQSLQQEEVLGYTPYTSAKGIQIYTGGGVMISDITSYANQQTQDYLNGQTSTLDSLNAQLGGLNDLADIMNELGDGALSEAMTNFYAAAQQLTQKPNDTVLRINYVNAAQNVAEKFNQISGLLDAKRSEYVGNVDSITSVQQSQAGVLTDSINSTLEQIAELNDSIVTMSTSGNAPSNLINQRNELLNSLSSMVDFTKTTNANGTINISIAGLTVVNGAEQTAKLNITTGDINNPAKVQIVAVDNVNQVKVDNIHDKLTGGQLKGVLDCASNTTGGITFDYVSDAIDTLAKTFAEQVNAIQKYNDGNKAAMAIGLDANGNQILVPSTADLFVVPADGSPINASNIKINQDVYDNPNLVAAARVDIDADGKPLDERAVGDSNNLVEIIALQNKNLPELGGVTFMSSLKSLVTKVGLAAANAQNKVDAQTDVVNQIQSKYESQIAVNLDEELVDMVKYQRAYEAASRVFSACNEMYQVLVNLGE